MDHDSSRVLQEVKDNSAIIGVLRELFEEEALELVERSATYSLEGVHVHMAAMFAARAAAFRSVVSTIMEYGVNDNG